MGTPIQLNSLTGMVVTVVKSNQALNHGGPVKTGILGLAIEPTALKVSLTDMFHQFVIGCLVRSHNPKTALHTYFFGGTIWLAHGIVAGKHGFDPPLPSLMLGPHGVRHPFFGFVRLPKGIKEDIHGL